jgi:hypothetical protein
MGALDRRVGTLPLGGVHQEKLTPIVIRGGAHCEVTVKIA